MKKLIKKHKVKPFDSSFEKSKKLYRKSKKKKPSHKKKIGNIPTTKRILLPATTGVYTK